MVLCFCYYTALSLSSFKRGALRQRGRQRGLFPPLPPPHWLQYCDLRTRFEKKICGQKFGSSNKWGRDELTGQQTLTELGQKKFREDEIKSGKKEKRKPLRFAGIREEFLFQSFKEIVGSTKFRFTTMFISLFLFLSNEPSPLPLPHTNTTIAGNDRVGNDNVKTS